MLQNSLNCESRAMLSALFEPCQHFVGTIAEYVMLMFAPDLF